MNIIHPIYFFGCWGRTGHYLYQPGGTSLIITALDMPWGYEIDGGLCPGKRRGPKAYQLPETQIEGQASLTKKDGWTALSFWDRSMDHRMNCNSNFIAKGYFSFDEIMMLAKQYFPEIMGRFKFEIKLAENK